MSIRAKRGILTGANCNNSVLDSSQGGSSSDSFRAVEFESLLPQATAAAIARAALFVASHAVDQTHRNDFDGKRIVSSESNVNGDS